jgi:hypothetical protein
MRKPRPTIDVVADGTDIFIVRNGKRIAKRGRPGTQQAKTWIPLEPGFVVFDDPGTDGSIVIEFNGQRIH